jgi:hypothetical protein
MDVHISLGLFWRSKGRSLKMNTAKLNLPGTVGVRAVNFFGRFEILYIRRLKAFAAIPLAAMPDAKRKAR